MEEGAARTVRPGGRGCVAARLEALALSDALDADFDA